MSNKVEKKDIPTNYYGTPCDPEHLKMIHADLISRPCKTCKALAGEECKPEFKKPGVHMGRVPDSYDTLHFLLAHLNGEKYDPQNPPKDVDVSEHDYIKEEIKKMNKDTPLTK